MFVNGINDKDLCNLIYKAGALLFPKYRVLFNDDIEEFQQHCAILILPKLKKYDNSKGSISTYIYNFLPLALGQWYNQSLECKTMLLSINSTSIEDILSTFKEPSDCKLFTDNIDIPNDLQIKELIDRIKLNYPTFFLKETEDLTFRQLGSRLKVGERKAKYLYSKDLSNIKKYMINY